MNKALSAGVLLVNKSTCSCRVLAARRCATSADTASAAPVKSNVPGLSKNIVDVPSIGVGFPAASKSGTYKNPEYFCYHSASYFEAEVEMMKFRLPQPSCLKDKN